MKALILSHSSDLAGAEQSMLGLFDYWAKTINIQSEFIIRKPVLKIGKELKKRKYKFHELYYTNWAQRSQTDDPAEIYWYAKQNTKAVADIEKIIRKSKPDIVMTNTVAAPWAAIAAYNQKIPHIWFIREFGDGLDFRLGREKTLELVGKLSSLVVANSESLAQFASKNIDKSKITVLYPHLDFNTINKLSTAKVSNPFKDQGCLKLVITGWISSTKGQAVAAEAVGILNAKGINCELAVVGGASEKRDEKDLMYIIDKYKIADNVHLIGHQQNPLPYVAAADVGITASSKEAFGRVTLEYMLLGKPTVGADAGGTAELINNGLTGFLFKPNNAEDLAAKILNYAQNRQLIKKHGQTAKQKALALTEGNHTPDELYRKIKALDAAKPNLGEDRKDWEKYPVLLTRDVKKPPKRAVLKLKHFIKSAYLKLK